MQYVYEQIKNKLEKLQNKMETYENQKQRKKPQLKKKDKIYLNIKNLKIKKPNKKLDYIKVGLFRIKAIKGIVNYKLELLAEAKIYPVFYILFLERVLNYEPIATIFAFEPKKEKVYKVEKILEKNKQNQYLIK